MRDHLGKIALVYQDEVVGVFDTLDEAILEGARRFGLVKMMFPKIGPPEPPAWMNYVDANHPSVKRLD